MKPNKCDPQIKLQALKKAMRKKAAAERRYQRARNIIVTIPQIILLIFHLCQCLRKWKSNVKKHKKLVSQLLSAGYELNDAEEVRRAYHCKEFTPI